MLYLLAVLACLPQSEEPAFSKAASSLTIPASPSDSSVWSYHDLLTDYMRVTDQQVLVTEAAQSRLTEIGSTFLTEFEVPPSEVQRIFETLLALQNFALARDAGSASESPWKIYDLNSAEDGEAANQFTPSVSVEELALYQDHPALLVECSLKAEGLDARSFSNACRGLIYNTSYQGVAAVGDSDEVHIRGRVTEVSHLVAGFLAANFEAPDWASTLRVDDLAGPNGVTPLPSSFYRSDTFLHLLFNYQAQTGTVQEIDAASLAEAKNCAIDSEAKECHRPGYQSHPQFGQTEPPWFG